MLCVGFSSLSLKHEVAELIGTSADPDSRVAASSLPLDQDPSQAEVLGARTLLRWRTLCVCRLGSQCLLHCPFLALPLPEACGAAASIPEMPAERGKLPFCQILGLWLAGARAAKKLRPRAVRQLSGHLKPAWRKKTLETFAALHGIVCMSCSPGGGRLAQRSHQNIPSIFPLRG